MYYYFKCVILWLCFFCAAFLLSNCATVEQEKPFFDIKDVKCHNGYILYCEGRFANNLDCKCVPNNIFNYPF